MCNVEPVSGGGLFLHQTTLPNSLSRDGLYLKRGLGFVRGEGLIFDPNSPFKNILILGAIL